MCHVQVSFVLCAVFSLCDVQSLVIPRGAGPRIESCRWPNMAPMAREALYDRVSARRLLTLKFLNSLICIECTIMLGKRLVDHSHENIMACQVIWLFR